MPQREGRLKLRQADLVTITAEYEERNTTQTLKKEVGYDQQKPVQTRHAISSHRKVRNQEPTELAASHLGFKSFTGAEAGDS